MTELTHLDARGQAHMVDVGAKAETAREAIATGRVSMQPETLRLLQAGDPSTGRSTGSRGTSGPALPKGDALGTARIAGIGEGVEIP